MLVDKFFARIIERLEDSIRKSIEKEHNTASKPPMQMIQ